MRTIILFLFLALCGCDKRVLKHVTTDPAGLNRVAISERHVASYDDVIHGRHSCLFESLVWQTNAGGRWVNRVVIPQTAFQKGFQDGSPQGRWVTEIHSFNPEKGTAIIKVGEIEILTDSPRRIRSNFSWREWSLLTNGEVRLVRSCTNRNEKY